VDKFRRSLRQQPEPKAGDRETETGRKFGKHEDSTLKGIPNFQTSIHALHALSYLANRLYRLDSLSILIYSITISLIFISNKSIFVYIYLYPMVLKHLIKDINCQTR
jgi:hypothetical protein